MSSTDGARSLRQSKRLSTTAFYMSVNAKDKEVEIDDELARGRSKVGRLGRINVDNWYSTEDITRTQGKDIITVETELCAGEGRQISGLEDSVVDPKPVAHRRGKRLYSMTAEARPLTQDAAKRVRQSLRRTVRYATRSVSK
jgi:hypothetical protein